MTLATSYAALESLTITRKGDLKGPVSREERSGDLGMMLESVECASSAAKTVEVKNNISQNVINFLERPINITRKNLA